MYYSKELDTLRRFAVFFIDMFIVGLCINLITAPYTIYLERELGSLNDATSRLYDALNDYINGIGSYDAIMNMMQGIFKYSMLVLVVTLPVSVLVYFLYFVLQPMKTNYQTLGRKLMHARVERLDGEPLNYKTLCIRELVGTCLFYNILGGIMIFISVIVLLVTKRTLVDHISKTNIYDLTKTINNDNGYYDNNGNYYTYNNNGYNNYNNDNYNDNNYDSNYDNNYDSNYDSSYNDNDYNNYDEDDNYKPDHYDDNNYDSR